MGVYTLQKTGQVDWPRLELVSELEAREVLDKWRHNLFQSSGFRVAEAYVARVDGSYCDYAPHIVCRDEKLAQNLREEIDGQLDEGMTATDKMRARDLASVKTVVRVLKRPFVH